MNQQLELPTTPPIQYKLPLRVERVDKSAIMARIVDAAGTPVCTLGNYQLACVMAAAPRLLDALSFHVQHGVFDDEDDCITSAQWDKGHKFAVDLLVELDP